MCNGYNLEHMVTFGSTKSPIANVCGVCSFSLENLLANIIFLARIFVASECR